MDLERATNILKSILFAIITCVISFLVIGTGEVFSYSLAHQKGWDILFVSPFSFLVGIALSWYFGQKWGYKLVKITTYANFGRWFLVVTFISYALYRGIYIWLTYDLEKSRQLIAAILFIVFSYMVLRGFITGAFMTEDEYDELNSDSNIKKHKYR